MSLASLKAIAYLFPLITIPYLLRVVGVEKYGLVAFAAAIVAYCDIIADYGFSLSATRSISVHRNRTDAINEIFSAVLVIKAFLVSITFVALVLLVSAVPKLRVEALLYLLSFGLVVGNALFPVWLFQGLERMTYIAALNFLAKSVFLASIFIFVRREEDYILIPALTSIGYIISGVVSLVVARYRLGVTFKIPSRERLKSQWNDGWHVFTSRIYLNIYTTTNTVLLGFLTNNTLVGYYSVATRILKAVNSVFEAANQAVYPRLAQVAESDMARFRISVRKIGIGFLASGSLVCLALMVLRRPVTVLLMGEFDPHLAAVILILTVQLTWRPLGSLFTNALISVGRSDLIARILLYAAIANLMLAPPAILLGGVNGLAIAVVTISAAVVFMCGRLLQSVLVRSSTVAAS